MNALVFPPKQEYYSRKGGFYAAYDCAAPPETAQERKPFMNFTYLLVALVVLTAAVVALYLYRRWIENHDDHYIHLHNDAHDAGIINSQTTIAKRLDTIDKLKNAGLVAVILYALAIAAMAVYAGWNSNAQG
jgi:hypothetical protein